MQDLDQENNQIVKILKICFEIDKRENMFQAPQTLHCQASLRGLFAFELQIIFRNVTTVTTAKKHSESGHRIYEFENDAS